MRTLVERFDFAIDPPTGRADEKSTMKVRGLAAVRTEIARVGLVVLRALLLVTERARLIVDRPFSRH